MFIMDLKLILIYTFFFQVYGLVFHYPLFDYFFKVNYINHFGKNVMRRSLIGFISYVCCIIDLKSGLQLCITNTRF